MHPVVYISQGKHAAYPQAGEWSGHSVPNWIARHTDFFRGNGVAIDTWQGDLHDLEETDANPAEFAPPAFQRIAARSPVTGLTDWTAFMGKWGPDLTILNLGSVTLRIGTSASGPKAKPDYGDFGARSGYPRWVDIKASNPALKVYADLGISIPPAPNPAPIRQ